MRDFSPYSIDLSCISPSIIGDYMVCPLRLVWDSEYPDEGENKYPHQQDFGTVCHYHAQEALGVTPPKKYSNETLLSAQDCPKVPGTIEGFWARVEECVNNANSTLSQAVTLAPGVTWKSEVNMYTKAVLPDRVNRKGETKGFGGSSDLVATDNSILWDYKFCGSLPTSAKMGYIIQLASYHVASGIPCTGIGWTEREAKRSCYLKINWTLPKFRLWIEKWHGFLKFVTHPEFRDMAWPCKGDACTFCAHQHRCPVMAVPKLQKLTPSLFHGPVGGNVAADPLSAILAAATSAGPQAVPGPEAEAPPAAPTPTVDPLDAMLAAALGQSGTAAETPPPPPADLEAPPPPPPVEVTDEGPPPLPAEAFQAPPPPLAEEEEQPPVTGRGTREPTADEIENAKPPFDTSNLTLDDLILGGSPKPQDESLF